jgi:hypothetical protein
MDSLMVPQQETPWRTLLDGGGGKAPRPVDPYLVWALWTDFRAFTPNSADLTELPFLVELNDPLNPPSQLAMRGLYAVALGAGDARAHCVTGLVQPRDLDAFLHSSEVVRCQLGLPRLASAARESMDAPHNCSLREEQDASKPVWFGIIDDGFAVAHPAFVDGQGVSRYRHLWDQNEHAASSHWHHTCVVGYGAELSWPASTPMPEASFYPSVDYLCELPSAPWRADQVPPGRTAHGTAVAGLAAGRNMAPGAAADPASDVPMVAVQLPRATVADTSGGSLGVHVLDGLRYILWRAEARSHGVRAPETQVVVNLSFGGAGGAHDGQSILECAMDELIAQRGNLAIVLPAGNSYRARVHADLSVPASGADPGRARFLVMPDDPTESFVELWFEKGAPVDEVRVRLTGPGGAQHTLRVGDAKAFGPIDRPWAHAMFCRHAAQSRRKAMLLLAIAPTCATHAAAGARLAPPGVWSMEVFRVNGGDVKCHAWIERDDLIGRRKVPQQTRFMAEVRGTETYSLNSLGHGAHTIVVAGAVRSTNWPAHYSSCGPGMSTRRSGPDISAGSEEGHAAAGLPVLGIRSWYRSGRMGGTSLAAPLVARWLINTLAAPTPMSVAAARALLLSPNNAALVPVTGSRTVRPPIPSQPGPSQRTSARQGVGVLKI